MNAALQRAGLSLKQSSSEIQGESGTGYETGALGEFECENCKYFRASDSSCGQRSMMAKSKQPRTKSGRVKVDPEGCCKFVHRLGKIEPHEAKEQ